MFVLHHFYTFIPAKKLSNTMTHFIVYIIDIKVGLVSPLLHLSTKYLYDLGIIVLCLVFGKTNTATSYKKSVAQTECR